MDDSERQHLESLRTTSTKRLHVLELQAATFGIYVPAHIAIELEDVRKQIAEIDRQLGARSAPAPVSASAASVASPGGSSVGPSFTPSVPLEVFFSYAHEDEKLRDKLAKQLRLLERQGIIAGWHDRRISAGTELTGQIDSHLEAARVILLLISSDFIASDYCYDVELKRALERHDAGTARVIPVILRPTDWHSAPFGKLLALPRDGKPITTWANEDEAFLDVARGIRRVAEELSKP